MLKVFEFTNFERVLISLKTASDKSPQKTLDAQNSLDPSLTLSFFL